MTLSSSLRVTLRASKYRTIQMHNKHVKRCSRFSSFHVLFVSLTLLNILSCPLVAQQEQQFSHWESVCVTVSPVLLCSQCNCEENDTLALALGEPALMTDGSGTVCRCGYSLRRRWATPKPCPFQKSCCFLEHLLGVTFPMHQGWHKQHLSPVTGYCWP